MPHVRCAVVGVAMAVTAVLTPVGLARAEGPSVVHSDLGHIAPHPDPHPILHPGISPSVVEGPLVYFGQNGRRLIHFVFGFPA
ncbi:hypothetical protein ACQ86B_28280 (plasmid) [Mycolicibacterium aichiense]|uniref:hypothetical protein n=1 Tax=Mycolicibacterium aichiense TaxID=1799 RepID=UPI003D67AE22